MRARTEGDSVPVRSAVVAQEHKITENGDL